jgi:hypothetical protein
VAEEKAHSLSNSSAEGARWLVVFDMERREQFEEISLLWAWSTELCLTVIGSSHVRSPLSVRMQVAALRHTEVVRELTALWAAVSSAAKLVLGHSPGETSQVEVMSELTTKFHKLEELCSWLQGPGAYICSLLLGSSPDQA